MSQTIRRGGGSGRAPVPPRSAKSGRARRGSSPIDRFMDALPFGEATLHRLFLTAILAGTAALAALLAVLTGVPALAEAQLASSAAAAGFEVRHVEVRGVRRMNELTIYEQVLEERDRAMPQVDLAALRERLLRLPYVDDARVSRQLPDTLVVDVVERVPHAVLRKGDRYVLIDVTGRELEPVGTERASRMLIVTGAGAKDEVRDLQRLLQVAPGMKAQLREADWIGKRRWNLVFKTGQVLALPEGGKEAASALLAFAKLDQANEMIGGRVAFFDMRVGDRIYLRVPGHARELEQARAERAKAEAAAKAARRAQGEGAGAAAKKETG